MMLEKFRFVSIAALGMVLVACAARPENERKDFVTEGRTYVPVHKQTVVIEESKTISSDAVNARYDEVVDEGTVIIASVPAKPVNKEDSLDTIQETLREDINVVTTDASYNAEPSVSYQIATIHFADGSAAVDTSYNAKIDEIAKLAKENNAKVDVYGFSSSRTKNTDIVAHKMINLNVSLKRAENVVKALRKAGVAQNNISMEALSDSQPLYQEVMPEGERLNRRAEIYISY